MPPRKQPAKTRAISSITRDDGERKGRMAPPKATSKPKFEAPLPTKQRASRRIFVRKQVTKPPTEPLEVESDSEATPDPPSPLNRGEAPDEDIIGDVVWRDVGSSECSVKTFVGPFKNLRVTKKARTGPVMKDPVEGTQHQPSVSSSQPQFNTTQLEQPLSSQSLQFSPRSTQIPQPDSPLHPLFGPPVQSSPITTNHSPGQSTNHSQAQTKGRTDRPQQESRGTGMLQPQLQSNRDHSQSSHSQPPPLDVVYMPDPMETVQDGPAAEGNDGAGLRRIRCRERRGADGIVIPSGRGVVIGAKLEAEVRGLKCRIKLQKGSDNTPVYGKWRTLLVHAIGMYVKESVPMNVRSFGKLTETDLRNIINNISAFFAIEKEEKWLEDFILHVAAKRFRAWKCFCHKHYVNYGPDLPYEFRDRPEQWKWLCDHFDEPGFQKLSERLKKTRVECSDRVNHCSGKMSYGERVEKYMEEGHIAPLVATFEDVYKKDHNGSRMVEKMKRQLDEIHGHEGSEVGSTIELSIEDQRKIITEARGKRSFTSKAGSLVGRPALPRGGNNSSYQAYRELQEELERNKEEQAREREAANAFRQ